MALRLSAPSSGHCPRGGLLVVDVVRVMHGTQELHVVTCGATGDPETQVVVGSTTRTLHLEFQEL